jgi:hypothetical protein
VRKDTDYRFELKPMGLTGATARSWQALREAASGQLPGERSLLATQRIALPVMAHEAAGGGRGTSSARTSPFGRLGGWLRRGS